MTVSISDFLTQGFTMITAGVTFLQNNLLLAAPVGLALAAWVLRLVKRNIA